MRWRQREDSAIGDMTKSFLASGDGSSFRLRLAELAKHSVDCIEGSVNLLADLSGIRKSILVRMITTHFGARQDDLARHENQQYNLGLEHTIYKTGEQLRSV